MMFGTLDRYKMFNIDCISSGIFHYTTKEFDEWLSIHDPQ